VYPPPATTPPKPPKPPPIAAAVKRLMQTSAEFVAGFTPPEYLWDGILQRRYCYSLTAITGHGKTAVALLLAMSVALERRLGGRDVERGRVLYFASENSVDVQSRWIAMAEHCGFDVNTIDVRFVSGVTKLSEIAVRITAEAKATGDLALVVVDTSAATFEGDDENSNVAALEHAKRMRSLTELPGGPTVLLLCHPKASATADNLQPRGGSALLGEMDGNLTAVKNGSMVEIGHTKLRAEDFATMTFELHTVTAERLKDHKGRSIKTVMAAPLDDDAKAALVAQGRRDQDMVLRAMYARPVASSNELAKGLGWNMRDGRPYGVRVRRAQEKLASFGLILKHRDEWILSAKGQKELNNFDHRAGKTYP
jgi:hypothetical protein